MDRLNANAGNPLSSTERNQLVNDLATNAKTRAQVLRAVAEDEDLKNAEFNRAFVLMQYFGYLRRNPDDPQDSDHTGYDFWLTKLNQFNGNYINARNGQRPSSPRSNTGNASAREPAKTRRTCKRRRSSG